MADNQKNRRRGEGGGWLTTLLGIAVLIVTGFVFGLVVGVVSEEPELVVGHLAGESEEVAWSSDAAPALTDAVPGGALPDVSAPLDSPPPVPEWDDSEPQELGSSESAAEPTAEALPPDRPPAAEAAMAVPEVPTLTGYSVQVGAFGDSVAAEKVAQGLRAKGFDVYLKPGAGGADSRWRVRVGPVSTRDEAERVSQILKTREHLPTWVLAEGEG